MILTIRSIKAVVSWMSHYQFYSDELWSNVKLKSFSVKNVKHKDYKNIPSFFNHWMCQIKMSFTLIYQCADYSTSQKIPNFEISNPFNPAIYANVK